MLKAGLVERVTIQAAVLKEARLLLEKSQATCHRLLRSRREQLHSLARRLLEVEVLSGGERKALLGSDEPVISEVAA